VLVGRYWINCAVIRTWSPERNTLLPPRHLRQLVGDLGQGFANALYSSPSAGDDAQCADLPKVGDQLVGHAIGEVILRSVAGKFSLAGLPKSEFGEGFVLGIENPNNEP